ncbi:MAG TPA: hypothetical protein VK191_16305, partial [Symbiobacteriaceae bacterium]|nr:hypothetical protein [Symbiobacteriaceae bacterium]
MLTAEMVKTAQFLGAIALSGGAVFLFLVWWPMLQHTPRPSIRLTPDVTANRLARIGAMLLLVFAPLDVVRLARLVADQPLFVTGIGLLWEVAVGTRYGQMALVRLMLGLVALAVTLTSCKHRKLRTGLLLALGLGAFATFSLSSHAASTAGQGPWPVLADLIHVAAIALWVGALLLLATLPWGPLMAERRGQLLLYRTTGRIASLALLAVLLLGGSGLYLASVRIYGVQAIPETNYGHA